MIRKHIKVEPARWYTYCDRLGVIVWQDMRVAIRIPSGRIGSILREQNLNGLLNQRLIYRKEWKEIIRLPLLLSLYWRHGTFQ